MSSRAHRSIVCFACGLGALALACESKFDGSPTATGGGASAGSTSQPNAAGAGAGDSAGAAAEGGAPNAPGAAGAPGTAGAAREGGAAGEGGTPGEEPEPSPVPLDGLALWLAADRGITLANGSVASWADQSGRGNDAEQLGLVERPSYSRTGLNGKPTVLFNGIAQFFDLPEGFTDFGRGVSVFSVRQDDQSPVCAAALELSTASEQDDIFFGQLMGKISYEVYTTNLTANAPLTFGVPELSAAIHGQNRRVRFRHNGQAFGEGQAELPAMALRDQCFVGKSLYQDCTTFSGAISELLLYERAVTEPELAQIESYLKERWGCCDG